MNGEALEALRYFSDGTHPQSFVTLAGRGPVLVSAPNALGPSQGRRTVHWHALPAAQPPLWRAVHL